MTVQCFAYKNAELSAKEKGKLQQSILDTIFKHGNSYLLHILRIILQPPSKHVGSSIGVQIAPSFTDLSSMQLINFCQTPHNMPDALLQCLLMANSVLRRRSIPVLIGGHLSPSLVSNKVSAQSGGGLQYTDVKKIGSPCMIMHP